MVGRRTSYKRIGLFPTEAQEVTKSPSAVVGLTLAELGELAEQVTDPYGVRAKVPFCEHPEATFVDIEVFAETRVWKNEDVAEVVCPTHKNTTRVAKTHRDPHGTTPFQLIQK